MSNQRFRIFCDQGSRSKHKLRCYYTFGCSPEVRMQQTGCLWMADFCSGCTVHLFIRSSQVHVHFRIKIHVCPSLLHSHPSHLREWNNVISLHRQVLFIDSEALPSIPSALCTFDSFTCSKAFQRGRWSSFGLDWHPSLEKPCKHWFHQFGLLAGDLPNTYQFKTEHLHMMSLVIF